MTRSAMPSPTRCGRRLFPIREGTVAFDCTFPAGCDALVLTASIVETTLMAKKRETEIFTRRRHRSEARDAPLQARKSEERQERKRRQGEKPEAGYRHRSLQGPQKGQESA